MRKPIAILSSLLLPVLSSGADWTVNAETGNSTLDAVFDAKLGERIHAVSSAVSCRVGYDEKSGLANGSCVVPLTAIVVDNEPTKTEHFRDWTTQKKSDSKDCRLEARLEAVKLGKLVPGKPVSFSAQLPFTVCGRGREGGGKESVTGTALLFPAGEYGDAPTVRIQASVKRFDREKYGIGPQFTEGWLARVQSLAKVVAKDGDIELRLFAHPEAPKAAAK
jgi:hypothetical protein